MKKRKLSVPFIEDLFQAVLAANLDEPVAIDREGAPRPEEPCCVIRVVGADPCDHGVTDFRVNVDTGEMEEFAREETRIALDIVFLGENAFDRACSCAGLMVSNQRVFDLWNVLGFSGVDPVTDTGTPFPGESREQAQFRIYAYAAFGTTYAAEYFTASRFGLELPEKPYREELILPNRS
ncbi:MAG: hypothetical protein LIP28_05320 [Deltaproteobacteria bacterium]|nr:hypothetical protein [Deltaproteobacteria bacterium]